MISVTTLHAEYQQWPPCPNWYWLCNIQQNSSYQGTCTRKIPSTTTNSRTGFCTYGVEISNNNKKIHFTPHSWIRSRELGSELNAGKSIKTKQRRKVFQRSTLRKHCALMAWHRVDLTVKESNRIYLWAMGSKSSMMIVIKDITIQDQNTFRSN